MIKRMLLVVLALILVFGGIFGWKAFVNAKIDEALANREPPPVAVTAAEVTPRVWTPALGAVGSLRAVSGIGLTSEVAGKVEKIYFESGERVEKGARLIQLEAAADIAELEGLRAEKALAATELERQRQLLEDNATAQANVDAARSEFRLARARVEEQQALIEKKTIRAPFTGRLGITEVDPGQYVSPGDTIVTLQKLDPIYVDFALPQQSLNDVHVGQMVKLRIDTWPEETFTGEITAIDPRVNQATRNFMLQATLENTDRRLRPGMFADVAVQLPERNEVLTLPNTAITYNPYGDSVFIIRRDGEDESGEPILRVERTFVETGEQRGAEIAIVEGLKAGQRVVTTGQLKLRNGARVVIDNSNRPGSAPSPTPPSGNPENIEGERDV